MIKRLFPETKKSISHCLAWLASTAAASIAVASCSDVDPERLQAYLDGGVSPNSSPSGQLEQLPSSYYRITAKFKILETDELIEFDYVAACGGIVARYSYTTPSVWHTWYPRLMIEPASDGTAVGLRTPNMCEPDAWGYENYDGTIITAEDTIPDDFLPFAVWFPDVHNLGWGIGYAADVAYESRLSKLEFVDASIERSSEDAWRTWRKQSAEQYQQVGGVPGPWGWQGAGGGSSPEEVQRSKELNGDRYFISVNTCSGGIRLDLPAGVQSEIDQLVPSENAQFISQHLFEGDWESVYEAMFAMSGVFFGGDLKHHFYGDGTELGVRRITGGGRVQYRGSRGLFYNERFPVLLYQTLPEGSVHRSAVLFNHEDWLGFVFCGLDGPSFDGLSAFTQDPSIELDIGVVPASEIIPSDLSTGLLIWAGEELIDTGLQSNNLRPGFLLFRDKYFFARCCAL